MSTADRPPPATAPSRPQPPLLRERPVGDSAVPRMELAEWAERYGVVAGITTRAHGFDLGLCSEAPVGQVITRWRAFHAAFRPAFPALVLSHQVHGTAVQWHRQATEGWLVLDGADGHATGARGILLTITVADCIPIYLVEPHRRIVALLHAGWRGAAGRIVERVMMLLSREASIQRSEIVMHCGVGICGVCYEVGSEVRSKLTSGRETTSGHVDLREVLVRQAHQLGLTQVSLSPWCSAHDREHFFSHRASRGRDGRMVAYLGMPRP